MAYTVKRQPAKPPKPERSGNSVLNKLKPDHLPIPTETVKESAHEVKEKLREDFSRWTRVRRAVSLKPMVGCLACDASGKVACGACGGAGNQKLVWNEEVQQCQTCEGTGEVTCSECMGRGEVENVHRKKIIAVFVIGGLAWAYVLFRLWGGDILPEQQAKYLTRGGGGGSTGAPAPTRGAMGQKHGTGSATLSGGAQPGANGAAGMLGQPGSAGGPRLGQPRIGQPGGMSNSAGFPNFPNR
jgi:hypothetical protein